MTTATTSPGIESVTAASMSTVVSTRNSASPSPQGRVYGKRASTNPSHSYVASSNSNHSTI